MLAPAQLLRRTSIIVTLTGSGDWGGGQYLWLGLWKRGYRCVTVVAVQGFHLVCSKRSFLVVVYGVLIWYCTITLAVFSVPPGVATFPSMPRSQDQRPPYAGTSLSRCLRVSHYSYGHSHPVASRVDSTLTSRVRSAVPSWREISIPVGIGKAYGHPVTTWRISPAGSTPPGRGDRCPQSVPSTLDPPRPDPSFRPRYNSKSCQVTLWSRSVRFLRCPHPGTLPRHPVFLRFCAPLAECGAHSSIEDQSMDLPSAIRAPCLRCPKTTQACGRALAKSHGIRRRKAIHKRQANCLFSFRTQTDRGPLVIAVFIQKDYLIYTWGPISEGRWSRIPGISLDSRLPSTPGYTV